MRVTETVLVSLDRQPWSAIVRGAVGFLVVPVWATLKRNQWPDWTLFPFFVGVLFALRVGPIVFRKVLRVSAEARAIWNERRQLAKRYDSYQWQKLLWMGIGLALYEVASGRRFYELSLLESLCLLGGAAGFAVWRSQSARGSGPGVRRAGAAASPVIASDIR